MTWTWMVNAAPGAPHDGVSPPRCLALKDLQVLLALAVMIVGDSAEYPHGAARQTHGITRQIATGILCLPPSQSVRDSGGKLIRVMVLSVLIHSNRRNRGPSLTGVG